MAAYTVENLVNMALDDIGYPKHVGNIYEGSPASRVALEFYGQIRDELIRATDWSFSRKILTLTLLKGPPPAGGYSLTQPWSTAYPYPGFLYEYSYPSDCLDLRTIIAPPGVMPDLDPVPALWRIDNDPVPVVTPGAPPTVSGPPAKVILCNMTNAMAVYRARITNPSLWEPGFIAAIVAALGKKFSKALAASPDAMKMAAVDGANTIQTAANVRG